MVKDFSKLKKKLNKSIKAKKVFKKSKMSYKIPEDKTEDVFDAPSRYFKKELKEAKRAMFFR